VAVRAIPPQAYDVVIRAGALDDSGAGIAAAVPAVRCAVVAPSPVAVLYAGRVVASLSAAGVAAEVIEFADGEANKTRETWAAITDALLERQFGRDSCIIALGGGVAGDLAGFVAATYMRGIPLVHLPTTLLAMIDASVGGKTGVDTRAGKNLVGAFHQPRLVLADPLVLRTLPAGELRSGLAEAVKHAAIVDADYFADIAADAAAILRIDGPVLERLIARSVEHKARIVAADPLEHGVRAVLNFGHTVGHALERRSSFGIAHGHAVAVGMLVEAQLGEDAGITESGTRVRLAGVLQRLGLPTSAGDATADELWPLLAVDKKARRGQPRTVLLRRIGACARAADGGWTHTVSRDALHAALAAVR
jgi:3-dehydroquinate synthase